MTTPSTQELQNQVAEAAGRDNRQIRLSPREVEAYNNAMIASHADNHFDMDQASFYIFLMEKADVDLKRKGVNKKQLAEAAGQVAEDLKKTLPKIDWDNIAASVTLQMFDALDRARGIGQGMGGV